MDMLFVLSVYPERGRVVGWERRVKSRCQELSLEALILRAALRGGSREDAKKSGVDVSGLL
jgi:hypothetical protein